MGVMMAGSGREKGTLGRLHTAHVLQNENIEEHEREPRRAKITETDPHHHLVERADAHMDMRVLGATKRDLPHQVYLCFIAMEFGMVEDRRGVLRWHPGKQEPVERSLSFEEVAAHYGLGVPTVREYDRRARRVYRAHRERADYLESRYGPDWEGDL